MKKYVIIAGAGISADSPSEFPTAIPIAEEIIDSIAPNETTIKKLLQSSNIRENIDNECKLSGDFLRFEMLMDSVSLIDKNLDVLDFIKL